MYEVRIHGLFDDAEAHTFDAPGQPSTIIRNGLARCVRIPRVVPSDGLQREGAVLDAASHRPTDIHRPPGAHHTIAAHQTPGGPQSHKPAIVGGVPNGAPRVLA